MPSPIVEIKLARRSITSADLSPDAPEGGAVLVDFPDGKRALTVTSAEQARLLRNRYPGLNLTSKFGGPVRFIWAPSSARAGKPTVCFATRHTIPAGRYLIADDAAPVPCDPAASRAKLSYDRKAGAVFAGSELTAFTYLGSVSLPGAAPLKAGSKLVLRTVSGPVTIDRTVQALQPARPGSRLFVRTNDGEILSRRLGKGEGQ